MVHSLSLGHAFDDSKRRRFGMSVPNYNRYLLNCMPNALALIRPGLENLILAIQKYKSKLYQGIIRQNIFHRLKQQLNN